MFAGGVVAQSAQFCCLLGYSGRKEQNPFFLRSEGESLMLWIWCYGLTQALASALVAYCSRSDGFRRGHQSSQVHSMRDAGDQFVPFSFPETFVVRPGNGVLPWDPTNTHQRRAAHTENSLLTPAICGPESCPDERMSEVKRIYFRN